MSEGKDFMLVDSLVHKAFKDRYKIKDGCDPLSRYGIKREDGEVVVELYLKKMNLLVIPNKSLFNFNAPMTIYVSRNDTLKILEAKI